ncbi:MAG: ATP phosphoribosyltransferase [Myxococcales bacterium]|nr:ATP phosphoribosyltransferase [Myxococcales bacterium]MCB9525156.1 ATP phosphoribosyltransferase [Myxococcales bacterium]
MADMIRLALPKGRMQDGVFRLLGDAGVQVRLGRRNYRPTVSLPGVETKILKPHNIVEMLHAGTRDVGFAGADWVAEKGVELTELLDTEMDPVRLVAAAPVDLLVDGALPKQHLVVASEYVNLTQAWIQRQGLDARFVRSYGATEVFPPEDADCIVDNTATGATLVANQLQIVDELMRSSTRMYAHPKTLDDPSRRDRIEHLAMLIRSVLEARRRVMLEVNVPADRLDALIAVLPCMREPTVAKLAGDAGFAVKSAVLRKVLPTLIPEIKACGGMDLVVSELAQIVP